MTKDRLIAYVTIKSKENIKDTLIDIHRNTYSALDLFKSNNGDAVTSF